MTHSLYVPPERTRQATRHSSRGAPPLHSPDDTHSPRASSARAALEETATLRVLVADDDPFINRLVQIRLKKRGYQISIASDGVQTLDQLREDPPDLVFLDVSMPLMSGLEVLEEIRREKLDVAVIMMTAFGSESIAVEAMRHGADDYLPKPFEAMDFEAVLERTTRRLLLTRQNAMLRRRLEMEMAQAAQVQSDLLPQSVPHLADFDLAAHFRPARAVSGDFYDWYPVGDRLLNLTLGDVMGKGMPAALLMATVRATMRVAGHMHAPAAALAATAVALGPDLERSGAFVTLFHAQLDRVNHRLTYANAGHQLGFVRRAHGALEFLEAQALPMGVLPDTTYAETAIDLEPGDMVIIYSDGLTDAQADRQLDQEQLAAAIEPNVDSETAISNLLDHVVPPGDLSDDLTVLALRYQP